MQVDAPKVEAPKPKSEAPKPKAEAPKPNAPKVEAPKAVEAPKVRQRSCVATFLHHTSVGSAAVSLITLYNVITCVHRPIASNGCMCWCHAYLSGYCASEF